MTATTRRSALSALQTIRERLAGGAMDDAEAEALLAEVGHLRRVAVNLAWTPYPWQMPPGVIETHGAWLMLGGRGTGKTEGAARYMDRHVMDGPPCDPRIKGGHRMAIVAPTLGDAADACVNGPSGLHTINPTTRLKGSTGGTHVHWPNGATARLFGAYTREDVERLRAGGNRCLVWFEELAAQRRLKEALEHTALGLRIGPSPHYIMSTTPKPRPELRELVASPRVLQTKGRTAEATHLDPSVRDALLATYAGTRTGRQELDAEILDDVEGAYWKMATIDALRFPDFDPTTGWEALSRLLTIEARTAIGLGPYTPNTRERRPWETWVAVDPPGETAECGIVVGCAPRNAAAGKDHAVILADYSLAGTPEQWGAEVVRAFKENGAKGVIVESNQGGDMTRSTIHAVDTTVPVTKLTAAASKAARAEPVSTLYERGWVHHRRHLVKLEDQLTTWVPDVSKSPDRLDALVHLVTKLLSMTPVTSSSVHSPLGRRPGGVPSARVGRP